MISYFYTWLASLTRAYEHAQSPSARKTLPGGGIAHRWKNTVTYYRRLYLWKTIDEMSYVTFGQAPNLSNQKALVATALGALWRLFKILVELRLI